MHKDAASAKKIQPRMHTDAHGWRRIFFRFHSLFTLRRQEGGSGILAQSLHAPETAKLCERGAGDSLRLCFLSAAGVEFMNSKISRKEWAADRNWERKKSVCIRVHPRLKFFAFIRDL